MFQYCLTLGLPEQRTLAGDAHLRQKEVDFIVVCMQIDLSVKGQLDKITQELNENPQLAAA